MRACHSTRPRVDSPAPSPAARQRGAEIKHRQHGADRLLLQMPVVARPKAGDRYAAVALRTQRFDVVFEARAVELAKEILELEHDALRLQLAAGIAESDRIACNDANGLELGREAPLLDDRRAPPAS